MILENCYSIDIEAALVTALAADDYSASAPPVTADLSAGDIVVYRVGGDRRSYVIDAHSVSIDCYADTDAAAVSLANEITGWFGDLHDLGGIPVYDVQLTVLPYANLDPDNRQLRRYTFAAQVLTRVEHR